MDNAWIQSYTGKKVYPLNIKPEEIDIVDIAWGLSNKCRYNGHTSRFYSVAEHSILVSQCVPKKYRLEGLLHDAAEAYLPDVPRPIKHLLMGFKEIEEDMERIIAEKYKLIFPYPDEVKEADTDIINNEYEALMPNPYNHYWSGLSGNKLSVEVIGCSSKIANEWFLEIFERLKRR